MVDKEIKILLIDDDEDDYVVTRDLLSEATNLRYELHWISSYKEALGRLCENKYDVYLLDYRLGSHTGLDLLQKASCQGCRSPFILLTGEGDHETDIKAMKAGAADYLVKGEISAPLLERSIRYAIERKRTEERIYHMAFYDSLTDLPNRVLFLDHLRLAIANAERYNYKSAVLFLDIDNFKRINDTFGHFMGDKLLKEIALRLSSIMRKCDSVTRNVPDLFARLGGDEFTVLLNVINEAEDAAKVAGRIIESISRPFKVDDYEMFITSSIGIAVFPEDGNDIDSLIKNADAAMYNAKERGKNNYQYYKQYMNAAAFERLTLENDLRKALERNEFLLHYQPQISVESGAITGLEALIRWKQPEGGIIPPSEFIPIAEDTGLIIPISEWILKTVCGQTKAWQAANYQMIPIAVNLSSQQFQQKDFIETLTRIIHDAAVAPGNLILEITESTILQNTKTSFAALSKLTEMGMQLAIDDFGTGYSSLSYLKKFPIHAIKIDRSFIREIGTDPDDEAITMAIISMAHSLRLNVIAEGVETEEQLTFLCKQGCNEIQGYLFSPPLPAEELANLLLAEKEGTGIGKLILKRLGITDDPIHKKTDLQQDKQTILLPGNGSKEGINNG